MNQGQAAIIDPGWLQILFAFGLVVATVIISRLRGLALEKDLTLAGIRAFLQLVAVGYVLKYIFALEQWYLILAFTAAMIIVATRAAVKRQKRPVPGLYGITGLALVVAAGLNVFLLTAVVVGQKPWYEPRYFIPLAGIIIGNSMNGAALAADRFAGELRIRRDEVEAYLALGATSRKAAAGAISNSLRAAIMNVVNTMMVAGIVTLPGMMTGQILSGTPPVIAVKYQIVIMYAIASAAAISALVTVGLLMGRYFTPDHQLRDIVLDRN